MSKHRNYGKRAPLVTFLSLSLLVAISCIAAGNSHAATVAHHHKSQHTHKHKRKRRHHRTATCTTTTVVNGKKTVSHSCNTPNDSCNQPSGNVCMPQEVPQEVKPGETEAVCVMAYTVNVPGEGCKGGGPIVGEPCYEANVEAGKCNVIPPEACEKAAAAGKTLPLCKEVITQEPPCNEPPPTEECPEEQAAVAGPKG